MPYLEHFRKAGFLHVDESLTVALNPQLQRFQQDESIFPRSGVPDRMYILTEGAVTVRDIWEDGRSYWIADREAPALLGEIALLLPDSVTTSKAEVITRRPTNALRITYDRVEHLSSDKKTIFLTDLSAIIATKLGQSMRHRAQYLATNWRDLNMLRRFVPEAGLAHNDRDESDVTSRHEKKRVVVLFSDIARFSEIAEQIKPDDLAILTSKFLDAQVNAIVSAGGEIDKFIGDAVMAFWIVDPDEEEIVGRRCSGALAAALRAANSVNAMPDPRSSGKGLRIRLGLHIGYAHVGNYGSATRAAFTLIGQDVNIAARLEQAREPKAGDPPLGSIRVSQEFANYLSHTEQTAVPCSTTVTVKTQEVPIRYSERD